MLFMNLMTAEQRRAIYPRFGLEWEWVFGAIREALTDARKRELMKESSNMFRVVIKTLHRAGIITDRTGPCTRRGSTCPRSPRRATRWSATRSPPTAWKFLQDINSNRAPRLRPAKS